MNERYRIAIAGATGAVGVEFLRLLEERKFPVTELRLVASARSAGKTLRFAGKDIIIQELTEAIAAFSWTDTKSLLHALTPLAWAYVLGSTIGATILGLFAYRVALGVIVAHRRHLAHQQQTKHSQ